MKVYKIMRLKKIKIQDEFKATPPKIEKLFAKLAYYAKYKQFESDIVINFDGTLVDGYTTYILANMMGKRLIKVRYKDEV